jgi:hypothetical protein
MLFPEPVGLHFLNGLLTIKLVLRKMHTHFKKLTYLGNHSLYQYETFSVCLQDFEVYILVLTPQLCINFEPQRHFLYGKKKSSSSISYAKEWKVTLFALVRCLFATS